MVFFVSLYRSQYDFCVIILVFVSVLYIAENFVECNAELHGLRNRLLSNYSVSKMESTETEVKLLYDAQHITKMDVKYGVLTIKGKFMMKWFDEALQWYANDFNDSKAITLSVIDIWHPEIHELLSSAFKKVWNSPLLVHHTGIVKWYPSAEFDAPCTIDVKNYPFDIQRCTLQFGSWDSYGNTLPLQIFDLPMNAIERSVGGEWELLNVTHKKTSTHGFCSLLPIVVAEISVRRTSSSSVYWHSCIIPHVVCCLVTLSEFWLGASDLHRSFVACCNMLACLATFLHLLLIAPSSNGTPIIVMCSALFTCASAIFILETITCSVITRSTRPPPKCLVHLSRQYGIQNSCFRAVSSSQNYCHRNCSVKSDADASDHGLVSFNDGASTPDDWYLISVALDRLMFWSYCLAYLITISVMLSI